LRVSARGEKHLETRDWVRLLLGKSNGANRIELNHLLYIRLFFLFFRLDLPRQPDKGASRM
jgi:hypothetical protein